MGNDITWVLQKGAIGARDYGRLITEIHARGERLEEVSVIPFIHEPAGVLPEISGPCLVYGFSGLLTLARREGWGPAGWDGEGFESAAVSRALGPLALNSDAVLTTWSQSAITAREAGWTRVFVRPNAETKEFAGRVTNVEELTEWVERLHAVNYFEAQDSEAIVAPAQRLGREWRLFVVGKRVVASSQYAQAGEGVRGDAAPTEVISFANAVLELYAPAPAFVLDIAEVEVKGGSALRVVELNSINSSGFYNADVGSILAALSDLIADLRMFSVPQHG